MGRMNESVGHIAVLLSLRLLLLLLLLGQSVMGPWDGRP